MCNTTTSMRATQAHAHSDPQSSAERAPTGLALLFALLLGGCASMQPNGYTEASAQLQQGDYDSAVRGFEQVAAANPDNESVLTSLAEARFKLADAAFNKAGQIPEQDLPSRRAQYRDAAAIAGRSLASLKALLSRPDDGPSVTERAQKLVDHNFQSLRERQEIQQRQTASLHAHIGQALQETEARLDKILADTKRLVEQNRAAPGSAYDGFVGLFPYAPYIAEVREAKAEIERSTIAQREQTGLEQIEKRDYAGAQQNFNRIGKIEGGAQRAAAGLSAIAAHKALLAKDYDSAFESMLAVRAANPESAFVKAYFEKTQAQLFSSHLEEIDRRIAAGKLGGLVDAFEKLNRLAAAGQGNAALLAPLDARRKELRRVMAAEYIRQALALKSQDETLYSSLILRDLRLARQLDPEQAAEHEALAAKASGVTARKGELKVLVAYSGGDGLRAELADRLNRDTQAAIEKQTIPGVTLLDASSTVRNHKDLRTADLVVEGRIDSADFVETGRDTPRHKSSRYVSGKRRVSNPKYAEAQEAYRQAEENYQQMRAIRDAALRNCNSLDNAFARIACQAGISMVASSDRDSAYAAWKATPEEIDENVISDYQYDEYTVRLNGQIRGQCHLVDNLTRTETACAKISERVKREGTIIKNAKAEDTEGMRNSQTNVPDVRREQEALFGSVSAAVSADLVKRVAGYRTERFCKLGELLEKQGARQPATEAFSLCALAMDNQPNDRTAQIEAKLKAHFLVSAAQMKSFAAVPADEVAKWPDADDIDDNTVALAMGKLARK
jgi:hypothetical protein